MISHYSFFNSLRFYHMRQLFLFLSFIDFFFAIRSFPFFLSLFIFWITRLTMIYLPFLRKGYKMIVDEIEHRKRFFILRSCFAIVCIIMRLELVEIMIIFLNRKYNEWSIVVVVLSALVLLLSCSNNSLIVQVFQLLFSINLYYYYCYLVYISLAQMPYKREAAKNLFITVLWLMRWD